MLEDNPSIDSELRLELKITQLLCQTIGSVRALTVYLMIKHQAYSELLELSVNASDYEDPQHFADDYLISNVLRKSPNLPIGVDRKQVALDSFIESEIQCRETNLRLVEGTHSPLLHGVAREIDRILGPLTESTLTKVIHRSGHGPGATTGVRGSGVTPAEKYDAKLHLTAGLVDFSKAIMGERWWSFNSAPRLVVPGNRFTTVPKSAKTDRGICTEPTLNMFIQKGIGQVLRERLRCSGIDLDYQATNRSLSQRAYSENLATIDLSRASDSVAYQLVLQLFSERWAHLLTLVRSDFCTLPSGEVLELEKISSMGNGFTFELESLIFFAVCRYIVPKNEHHLIGVYGDDIICPTAYSEDLIEALNYLGFEVNTSKSFLAGSFYESCGAHWFKGVDVTPFYLKGSKESIPYALQIANKIRLYAKRVGFPFGCDDRFRKVWLECYHAIPKIYKKCLVPESLGDVGIICSLMEAKRVIRKPTYKGHQGYSVRTIRVPPVKRRLDSYSVVLCGLSHNSRSFDFLNIENPPFSKGRLPVRGYLGKPVPKYVHVSTWTAGLEWITWPS